MLKDKRVVVGVTGGIAVYKACDLVSRLKKQGAQVRVVLTPNACKFVPPLTFETLSENPACVDTFAPRSEITHISLAKWAEAMVIAKSLVGRPDYSVTVIPDGVAVIVRESAVSA